MGNANSIHVQTEKPFYIAGEHVTGTVHLNIAKAITSRGVYLKIKGLETCGWTEVRHEGKQQRQVHHRGKHSFFRCKVPVFRQAGEIPIGQYAFPFDFDLPPDLPGSFRVQEGNMYASILYKVKAEVSVKGVFKSNIKSKHHLQIHERLTRAIERPVVQEGRDVFILWCINRGRASMRLALDKDAFVPGEHAQVCFELNNESKANITEIRCKLRRVLALKASSHGRKFGHVLASRHMPGVPKLTSAWNEHAKRVTMPLENQGPITMIQPEVHGKLVDCRYFIEIEAVVGWGKNLHLALPICIYAPLPAPAPLPTPPPEWNPHVYERVAIGNVMQPEYAY